MPGPEAFSAERYRQIMALRGAASPEKKSVSEPEDKGTMLPEVIIRPEKEPLDDFMEDYIDIAQQFEDHPLTPELKQDDDWLLDALEESVDFRTLRIESGMMKFSGKMEELGLKIEDNLDDMEDVLGGITTEETDKKSQKKLKKISKKIKKCANSSLKIGKKQIKISDRELEKIKKTGLVSDAENIELTDDMRNNIFDYVEETYKIANKDLEAYRRLQQKNAKEHNSANVQKMFLEGRLSRWK